MTAAGGAAPGPDRELMNPDARVVTVWSDVGCPWATLALATLHEAAARSGADVIVDHRHSRWS